MPAAGHNILIDQILAERYHVTAKIGEGGMGSVYKANDLKLNSEVVIKTPHAALIKDAEFAARFRREIRSLVQLSHAHIVKVMDVGVHDGLPFAVMQYLPGGSLEDRQRPCDPTEILEWLNDIADALDFMHQRGLIHRDVKPANILLDESGRAYLGDFGIAKVVAADDESNPKGLTGTGTMIGTGEFMAPEMLMPDLYSDEYNERVDQYALAVTVYEMLAGRPPFRGDTIATVAVKMARTKAPLLHELNPSISESLSRAVARGLLKKPDRRYPDCRAFAEAVSIAITSATGRTTSVGVRASTGSERRTPPIERPSSKRRVTTAARTMIEERPSRRRTMAADEPSIDGRLTGKNRGGRSTTPPRAGGWVVPCLLMFAAFVLMTFLVGGRPTGGTLLAVAIIGGAIALLSKRDWLDKVFGPLGVNAPAKRYAVLGVTVLFMLVTFTASDSKKDDTTAAPDVASSANESEEASLESPASSIAKNGAGDTLRSRWLNETYNVTVRRAGDKSWEQVENKTGRVKKRYTETFDAQRKQEIRLFANRMELKKDGKWIWVAKGRWDAASKRGIVSPLR
jgi:serine/threonine protein kinase